MEYVILQQYILDKTSSNYQIWNNNSKISNAQVI